MPSFIAIFAAHIWLAQSIFRARVCHTFTSCILGFKASPFDLYFPEISIVVPVAQFGINQNINDTKLFASGHWFAAALVALTGSLHGNERLRLPLSRIA